jgi:Domain of unknown function (DUF4082)
MAFRLVNTFEGDTAGAVLPSAGQSNGSGQRSGNAFDRIAGGAGVIADGTTFLHGSRSGKINLGGPSNSGGVGWMQQSLVTGPTTAYLRFYFRVETFPGSTARWIVFADTGAANALAAVLLRTDGKLELADTAFGVQATSTTTLTTGQWYRIEVKLVSAGGTGGSLEVKLFIGGNVEGSTPDETISFTGQNTNGSGLQWLNIGATAGVTNFSMWVDSIELNDTGYPGLFAPPVPAIYETLFANGTYPFMSPKTMDDSSDGNTYTFGMAFTPSVDGKVYGAAWCNPNATTSGEQAVTPRIALYPGPSGGATALATKTTTVTEVRANWNYELFTSPIDVVAGTTYMIAVLHQKYSYESAYFNLAGGGHGTQTQGHLTAEGATGTGNNFFTSGGSLAKPTTNPNNTWYGIDVLFQQSAAPSQGVWGISLS